MTRSFDPVRHAAEYRERGYTVARGFFDDGEVARMRAAVDHCEMLDRDRGPTAITDGGLVYNGAIFNRSEDMRAILSSQRLVDMLAAIAGGDLWVTMDQAVTKKPGAGVFHWHQDNGYNRLKAEHYQVWIALTKTERRNGALTLAPGSHQRGLLPHTSVGKGQMKVDAEIGPTEVVDATAGDLIIFSSLMLHCTGPNEADSVRIAYVAEFMPLRDYVPAATPPYWVVARDGRSCPEFTSRKPGARSLRNQMMYLAPRTAAAIKRPLRWMKHRLLPK